MALQLRPYAPGDFEQLYTLDHQCFPRGIAYSRRMLGYFLRMPQGRCIVAVDPSAAEPSPAENSAEESAVSEPSAIVAFIITEEDPPLAHILTLDVAESHRRYGLGTQLLARSEQELIARGVTEIVLETGIANAAGVAFWQRHDFRTEGVLKRYYLGRLDAYRMRKKLIVAQ